MSAGVLAIAGIYPFAGFFSKDEILYRVFTLESNPGLGKVLWAVGLITAGLTSFYMFRLWFKTFFGPTRFDEHEPLGSHGAPVHASSTSTLTLEAEPDKAHAHGVHESPWIMLTPLVLLAILSIVGGWVGVPAALGGHNEIEHFLAPVFSTAAEATAPAITSHSLELTLAAASLLTAALGFLVAWQFYYRKPLTAAAIANRFPAVYSVVANKFYVDEVYSFFVVLLLALTRGFLSFLSEGIVNGVSWLAGRSTQGLGNVTRSMQSGNIRSYAGWLALGAAALIAVMIFSTVWTH
jgi:NADH-quinone oxidoreductase subunit L